MKRGKKYIEAAKNVEAGKLYSVPEACELVKKMSYAKFDETVELHVYLQLKKSQTVRDTMVLPNQFAAEKKILVFAKGDKAKEAEEAGAAYVGDADLIAKIQGGWSDFDVCVATPDMMKDVGRLGPVLGRRGLMPNPKTQTVTMDIKGAVAQLKLGRTEFRSDKLGVIHMSIGKVSMDPAKVAENVGSALREITKRKPADTKGSFIISAAIASTMGPGVMIEDSFEVVEK